MKLSAHSYSERMARAYRRAIRRVGVFLGVLELLVALSVSTAGYAAFSGVQSASAGTLTTATMPAPSGLASNVTCASQPSQQNTFSTTGPHPWQCSGYSGAASVAAPTALNRRSPLLAVTCPSATECVATSTTGNVVSFNPDNAGAITISVQPTNIAASSLNAVSCFSSTLCTAVDAGGNIFSFNPDNSGVVSVIDKLAAGAGDLQALACIQTTTDCTVATTGGDVLTYSVTTAGVIAITAGPVALVPSSQPNKWLSDVGCVSTTLCTAKATANGLAPGVNPYVYNYDPVTLATVSSNDAMPGIHGLSCVWGWQCVASSVANGLDYEYNPDTNTVTQRGSSWNPSIFCVSSTECVLVGSPGGFATLNPTSGAAFAAPLDSNDNTASWCVSTTECVTVSSHANAIITYNPDNAGAITVLAGPIYVGLIIHHLRSVACPSTTLCVAVDNLGNVVSYDPATGKVVAKLTNVDQQWALYGVACPSATECVAVASNSSVVTFNPDNAGTITVLAGPSTLEASSIVMLGVACPSATECVAVASNSSVVTFNPDNAGTITVLAGPTEVIAYSWIESVVCFSTTACAVTGSTTGAGGHAMATVITVSATTITPATPFALTSDEATSSNQLSCPSTTQCVAVLNGSAAVVFDPATSSVTSTLATPSQANALSCATTTQCMYGDNAGHFYSFNPLASSVTFQESGTVAAGGVNALACVGTCGSDLTVVDSQGDETTLSLATSGVNALISGPVSVTSSATLHAVSCTSTTECVAVGYATGTEIVYDPTNMSTLYGPYTIDTNTVTGVACVSSTLCTSVDTAGDGIVFDPATGVVGADSAVAAGDSLLGVSCPSSTTCTAVGSTTTGGVIVSFSVTSSSITSIVAAATPEQVNAVGCATATLCVAVGDAGAVYLYTPGGAPVSATVSSADLTALSCSSSLCTVVDNSGHTISFTYTATAVTVTSPLTTIDSAIPLSSLACPTATRCVAGDANGNAVIFAPGTTGAMVENSPTVITPGLALMALTCFSSSFCTAVGMNSTASSITIDSCLSPEGYLAGGECAGNPISMVYSWSATQIDDALGAPLAASWRIVSGSQPAGSCAPPQPSSASIPSGWTVVATGAFSNNSSESISTPDLTNTCYAVETLSDDNWSSALLTPVSWS